MIGRLTAAVGVALTRAALRAYPPAFRREMGDGIVADVRRRGHAFRGVSGAVGAAAWLVRLGVSLAFNAVGAWRDGGGGRGVGRPDPAGGLFSWLDVKLGLRMLVKSPLLTVTGCVAIATAIALNAGFHEFTGDFLSRFETVASNGRMVALENRDRESGGREARVLEDVARWRAGLETIEHVGVVSTLDVNLVGPDGASTPVATAEVSGSVFSILGTRPFLGRMLAGADDGPAAEPVVVLGHGIWRRVLDGDPDVVGTTVRLGEVVHTVVGVAPESLTFPSGREDVWVNFRHDPASFARRSGPAVRAFAQLAPGRSLEEAQAEMERLGALASADHPDTHGQLRPVVRRYEDTVGLAGSPEARWALRAVRTFFVLLLLAACANVATLVFARNAGRESEIAVRHALGAGRRRILAQLFAEAMVLALVSAGAGLLVAHLGLTHGSALFWEAQRMEPPAWFDAGVSLSTVLYSLLLAVVGAGVVGVLPGLRATRRDAARALQQTGQGRGSLAFGWLPTGVIVFQTALTVALLPVVLAETVAELGEPRLETTIATGSYLTARLLPDSEVRRITEAEDAAAGGETRYQAVAGVSDRYPLTGTLLARYEAMARDIEARLEREPGVRRVVLTSRLPGVVGQSIPATRVELGGETNPEGGYWTATTDADLELFDAIGRDVLDGRALTRADYGNDHRVALVNTAFVDDLYRGRSPVGRLVRDLRRGPDGPWTEIVGVVPDEVAGPGHERPHMYLPRDRAAAFPLKLLVQVDGDPAALGPRLRSLVAAAEPGMLLDEVIPLAELRRNEVLSGLFAMGILFFVGLVTLLLSTTGVYALMSFIVARRTREIGIRTALGADATRIVSGVFRQTLLRLGAGVVLGLAVVGMMASEHVAADANRELAVVVLGVVAVLVVVGLVGCAVPLARALRVQPMQALSAE